MALNISLLVLFILGAAISEGASVNRHDIGKWTQLSQKTHPSLDILNGNKTDIKDYPFVACALINGIMYGGGVVLNKRWILTTGFNVFDWDPAHIMFRVGSEKWISGGQVVRAQEVHIHPNYTSDSWNYEIAVVKTKEVIRFGEKVQPGKLGTEDLKAGTVGSIAGWGVYNKTWIPSDYLRSANLTVLGRKPCAKVYPDDLTENLMCTTANKRYGACTGDFGAPLVVNGTVYGLYAGSDSCYVPNTSPQLYTNVPAFYQWVQSYVDSEGEEDE